MAADPSPYGQFFKVVVDGSDQEIQAALQQAPADERAGWGYQALKSVCNESFGAEGSLARVRSLLAAGARFPEQVGKDETPLHDAASSGFAETLRLLLESGGRVALGTYNDINDTPLASAARDGQLEAARVLIEAGADVNAHDEDEAGDTPLARAVTWRHEAVVKLLLEHGADPDITGWMGLSARDRATDEEDTALHPELRRIAVLINARVRPGNP